MNVMFALFNLGGGEIILILALVLILFGAKKLPELAKGLGTGIKEFKKATREVTDEIQSAAFGQEYGSSGECKHPSTAPHAKGEWRGALIRLRDPLLAQYAVSHYLEQERVLDADVE